MSPEHQEQEQEQEQKQKQALKECESILYCSLKFLAISYLPHTYKYSALNRTIYI